MIEIRSDISGIVSNILVAEGQTIEQGVPVVAIESMKMETLITAPENGIIHAIEIKKGSLINEGDVLFLFQTSNLTEGIQDPKNPNPATKILRSELSELINRRFLLTDKARPEAIKKRHQKGHLTSRESIEIIIDKDTLNEYGSLIIAAQRSRRDEEDLIKNTPADGLITGTATINKDLTKGSNSVLVMAYDYTVLAGTQGAFNHLKMDRMLDIASKRKLPVILLAEGGGGRPGDVDHQIVAGLHVMTFYKYAALDGVVPRISVVTGYCFAGNAALAGISDILIATKSASIGMGGPAMIEGGGLGSFHPKEIGPSEVQSQNGVIDILVEDDTTAMNMAKHVLQYFQGDTIQYKNHDQSSLREIIPQERRRVYEMRSIINTLCDVDSVTELQSHFGRSAITSLVRIEGKSYGLIANDCRRQAGALTADATNKIADFLELCNKNNLPVLSLVDCPGLMVGPKAEADGTVRNAGRLFIVSAKLNVPIIAIVVRRGFGLGAMAMTGGSFHASRCTLSWPTGQFGAMGIEGAVKLGFKRELDAIEDPEEQTATYNKMVDEMYHQGRAINMASYLEIDEVIDPIETREWIINANL